jgi:hypothetical protein
LATTTAVANGRVAGKLAEWLESAQKDIKTSTMLKQAKTRKAVFRRVLS